MSTVSPSTARVSRDVARILTFPDRPRIAAIGRSRGGEDVLAVVDHQQEPPTSERIGNRVDQGRVALWRDAEHGRDRSRDGGRVADRCELDHPHAVGELAGDLGPDLEGQPRLADPADAGQRDQPARPHELGDFGDDVLAADQ